MLGSGCTLHFFVRTSSDFCVFWLSFEVSQPKPNQKADWKFAESQVGIHWSVWPFQPSEYFVGYDAEIL